MKPADKVTHPTKEQVRMEMDEIRKARESGNPLSMEEIRRQLGWVAIQAKASGILR